MKIITNVSLVLILTSILLLQLSCERKESPDAEGLLTVYVVNYPLYYFASRIGGAEVAVHFPAPDAVDPAEWIPDDAVIQLYQAADLIVLNGAGYAQWTEKVALLPSVIVNAAAAVEERFIEAAESVAHSHGPHGEHTHGGTAFTLWLDPTLAIEQARAIQLALASRLPAHAELFERRLVALMEDLLELDAQISAAVGNNAARPVFFSHPVYQYLEARYGLNGFSFHWEADAVPTETEWSQLREVLKSHPAKWMIWEDAPLPEIVERLAAAGVRSVVFNPSSQPPAAADFSRSMQANVETLRAVYAD